MVSSTRQQQTRREIRKKSAGRISRIAKAKNGTPRFPVHPEGYDSNAADARPSSK